MSWTSRAAEIAMNRGATIPWCGLILFIVCVVLRGAAPARANELLPDGGFESGGDLWYGGTIVDSQPHGGGHCLLVEDLDTAAILAACRLLPAPVTPGSSYGS